MASIVEGLVLQVMMGGGVGWEGEMKDGMGAMVLRVGGRGRDEEDVKVCRGKWRRGARRAAWRW